MVRDGDFIQVIEPGMYNVYAGGHQPDDTNAPGTVLKVAFTITGDTTPLSKCWHSRLAAAVLFASCSDIFADYNNIRTMCMYIYT